ncbi:phage terminase large subunit [Neisseria subflava]|uniref:phage terminase large subunit n=1 Tax=Neisseria TaxID=482 RepID=UPI00202A92A5|nr:phage terminase large subunit [Neisseria subflava]MCL9764309.1 phage terminase large subunit [Neisseria subflava]
MKNKEFLKSLAELAASLRQVIEAEVDGFDASPKVIAARRAKVFDPVGGYEYFVNTYFPHYIRSPEKSELHEFLFSRLPEIIRSPKGENEAVGAPRGEGKSTQVTQLFTLWCIVTGQKHYAVIVMDSIDQAYPMLEAIKAELEFNPRLKTDFPEVCGQGRVWQAGTIVTANDVKVQVAGSGKKLRGLRHGPYRPDLTILDDIENDEQVRNPEQRDKLNAWLTKTVLPLGGVGQKYDVIYIGTILHYDSVLNRTLNNPFWKGIKFKAMKRWPDRMDLWGRWEELYRNDGAAVAEAFYQANKDEMERGAVTSWAARGVLALMKIRARDGHATFDSEYQNDPVSGEDAPFAKSMKFWTDLPSDLVYFGSLDPSLGKAGASRDPSAIIIGGYQRQTGKLYIVEAQIKKRLPDLIIEDVIRLHRQYRCKLWFVETVQFQEFLKDELVKRSAARGLPVPARAVKPVSDKLLRIETLQPHMANGLILLNESQQTLVQQFRHFPKADHDDGPDAVHMLWSGAVANCVPIEWQSPNDDDFDDDIRSKWSR